MSFDDYEKTACRAMVTDLLGRHVLKLRHYKGQISSYVCVNDGTLYAHSTFVDNLLIVIYTFYLLLIYAALVLDVSLGSKGHFAFFFMGPLPVG